MPRIKGPLLAPKIRGQVGTLQTVNLQTPQNITIIQQMQTKTRDPVPVFTFVPELFVNAGNDFPRQFLDIL